MSSVSKLFQAIKVGNSNLSHRVVLAPLTRARASSQNVPSDLALQYYTQRSSTPGSLLVTEATVIAPRADGQANVPHIVTEEQIKAWKKVQFLYLSFLSCSNMSNR